MILYVSKASEADKWAIAGEKRQNVGQNFTLKPSTKARSLQFCQTARKREISDGYMAYLLTEETSAITQNRSSREWVKDSFTRLIYSCHCHFIHIYVYMYVCIYNFLWIILIPSLWSELLLRYVVRA